MRILRVFPERTSYTPDDDLVAIGHPGLFLPQADEVHVSIAFTWDIPLGNRLAVAWAKYYPIVKLGGPAFASPCDEFTSGMYVRPGITFTSRGCPRRCPWCFVPKREGELREIPDFPAGNWIADNNLLACPDRHVRKVLEMLEGQYEIQFPGGLDVRYLKDWHVAALKTLRVEQLFLGYDSPDVPILSAIDRLRMAGFTQRQVRVYILVGFGTDTPEQAEKRLQFTFDAGALPFPMRYRDENGRYVVDRAYHALVRKWSRPAAVFATEQK